MYQGTGHETFQIQKLFGFVLIVLGVLFYNRVLAFEGFKLRFLPKDEEVVQDGKNDEVVELRDDSQEPNDRDEEEDSSLVKESEQTQ